MKAGAFALVLLAAPAAAAAPVNDAAMAVKALASVCVDRQGDAAGMRGAMDGWTQAAATPPMLMHRKPTPVFGKTFGGVQAALDIGDDGTCAAVVSGAMQDAVRLAVEAELKGRKFKYILAGDVNDNGRRVLMLHYVRQRALSEIVLTGSVKVLGPVTVSFLPLRPIDSVDGDAALLR